MIKYYTFNSIINSKDSSEIEFEISKQSKLTQTIFNKAIELRPNFSEAFCRKGACYEALKREEEAVVEYEQAVELNDIHSTEILYQASFFLANYYKNKNSNLAHLFLIKINKYFQNLRKICHLLLYNSLIFYLIDLL